MFTGLVEEKATVAAIEPTGDNFRLSVQTKVVHQDAAIGDSISINGCCLTVVQVEGQVLSFEAVPETMNRTNLGKLAKGSFVNLERAVSPTTRLGGHYVTGHIDGPATVARIEQNEDWWKIYFSTDQKLTRQMASKGSVAIDGISLTLVDVIGDEFSVVVIPHTLNETTVGERKVNDTVNIETDLLAKYVEKQLQCMDFQNSGTS